MIVAAIVIINPDIANFSAKHFATREAITLEEAILGELSAKDFDFRWLPATDSNGDADDQLLFDDFKNINLVTMPSSEHRNYLLANRTLLQKQSPPTGASGTHFHNNNNINQLQQQNFKPNITTLVSNASLLSSIEYQGYKLSPSKRYLLIWTSKKKQFRYSFTAKYFLYDIKLDLISLLSTKEQQSRHRMPIATGANGGVGGDTGSSATDTGFGSQQSHNLYEQLDSASSYLNDQVEGNDELARFQLVDWYASELKDQPKQMSDSLVLIQNNDIYTLNNVADLNSALSPDSGRQASAYPVRLTYTGKPNEIFNGIPDWLYEEEILGDTLAFQVSPSGNKLAYMSFDDSQVATMPFSFYGETVIPRIQRIKYPKAGQPNPRVSVHIIENLNDNNNKHNDHELSLPDDLGHQQHYINRINWLTDNKLALIWSNRNQNNSFIIICSLLHSSSDWICEKNLHLKAEGGWLDVSDDIYALDDDHYLALLLKDEGQDVGSFKHLAKVSLTKPNSYVFITNGHKDVLAINGVDSKRSLVYYTSTVINEPGQRQLFVAELDSTQATMGSQQQMIEPGSSVCVTCDHYPSECLYNIAKMSPSTNYYIFQCDGPGVPRTELRATRRRRHRLSYATTTETKVNSRRRKVLTGQRQQQRELSHLPLDISNDAQRVEPPSKTNDTADSQSIYASWPTQGDGQQQTIANQQTIPRYPPHQNSDDGDDNDDDEGNSNGQENLLWTIEDNKELREKLEHVKALPLTMRLKVPIPNTNYLADVLLLLPPQLSPTTSLKSMPISSSNLASTIPQRPLRGGILSGHYLNEQPLHSYYTPETIKDYTSQLASGQQFPMVVDVYAGPGSQKVDYRFNIYFGHFLASSRRTIYAMIDGRGSGFQGTKRLYEIYHRFGTVEIQDQIEVAAYLARNLSFIDPTKLAIWGWSYGGYAAAMALAQSNAKALQAFQAQLKYLNSAEASSRPPNSTATTALPQLVTRTDPARPRPVMPRSLHGVFECAASVAPVTNWIYYDTAYTEKYMSCPWMNELYDQSSAGDHLLLSSTNSNQNSNQTSQQLTQHHQQLPPHQPQQLTANKWAPLNQTNPYRRSSNLVDLMMRTSLGSVDRAQEALTKSPRVNLLDLNERYRRASLLEQIGNIDKKRFLLIHGTADDNVHFQQSIMLMKRLIRKNVLFETRLYPDQDHSIANKADKLHLGSTLSNFFAECFDMI